MEFLNFRNALQKNFAKMTKDATHLFEVAVDKDEMWNLYLDSFPAGTNEIYRERREYDCSCCRHFIKTIGNAVVIKDNTVHTIWDVSGVGTTFQPVADALSAYIKANAVTDVYVSQEKKIGTERSLERLENGKVNSYDHFFLELPDKFVFDKRRSAGDIKGTFRDTRNVFKRSLDEITEESVMTVLELISQNSLYKGEEWKAPLTEFLKYKKAYDKLTVEEEKENFAWEKSITAGAGIGRIRNHSIGVLLTNISEGMDLDTAVKKYEQIVAPANYKRQRQSTQRRCWMTQGRRLRKWVICHLWSVDSPRLMTFPSTIYFFSIRTHIGAYRAQEACLQAWKRTLQSIRNGSLVWRKYQRQIS